VARDFRDAMTNRDNLTVRQVQNEKSAGRLRHACWNMTEMPGDPGRTRPPISREPAGGIPIMTRQVERLSPETRQFLHYLQTHPLVRARIRAPKNTTILYAGDCFEPAYKEIRTLIGTRPEYRHLVTIEHVLNDVPAPDTSYPTLQAYVDAVAGAVPKYDDQFILWRALSGIYVSNAEGQVSFYTGDGISRDNDDLERRKVFAVTELPVLGRNENVDALTRDIVAYYQRCLSTPQASTGFAFIGGIGRLDS
jgi:hypothetical protein